MTQTARDWRVVDGVATAWFDAPSLVEGAALAGRVLEVPAVAVDVRATGVRVRVDSPEHADLVSGVARRLGLAADPGALQQVSVLVDSADPPSVSAFWQRALGYPPGDSDTLVDPWRRDPAMRFRRSDDPRPLRNRIHLDVVRPSAVVEAAGLGEASGPYGVCHADPDGNEVDLVPGSPLSDADGTSDWQAVFSAVACYRVSREQQRDLAAAAAGLAHEAGFPLMVDLRPGLVVLDSGKDQWDQEAHGLGLDFVELAARLQGVARELGARADRALPRFVQLFLDAADVPDVRRFWASAFGYLPDRRDGATDLYDPRRLGPVLVFQELDASDAARRRQRNRMHVELAVPPDVAAGRVAAALAAGGRLLDDTDGRWLVADPEGNELVVVAST